jgi:restriction system protein
VRANATICLIHQANYLLDQQIAALERAFINDGGYSEQLATARLAERQRKKEPTDQTILTDQSSRIPVCPNCTKPMVLRTAKTGKNVGQQFWGCSAYPDCKGVVKL